MNEFLLPSTDGGVLIQIVATILVAPILVLVAKWQPDLAWLAGGVIALWIGHMGFRALH